MVGKRKKKTLDQLPPRVYQKHGAYYLVDRNNKWIRLGKEYKESMKKWAELMGETVAGETVAELWEIYQKEVLPGKAAKTQAGNRKEAVNLLKAFGHVYAADILPRHITAYLRKRANQGAPIMGNREKALLSHMMSFARNELGWIDSNPCLKTGRNAEKARDRCPEWSEIQAIRGLAAPQWQYYIDLKYMTGLRQGDLLTLKQEQITEDGIQIKSSKTQKKGLIAWTPDLKATVDKIRALQKVSGMYLFCKPNGRPYTSSGFQSMWHRLMSKAIEAKLIKERFTEHDIRAAHATEAASQGIDPQTNLMHTNSGTTAAYLRDKKPTPITPIKKKGV